MTNNWRALVIRSAACLFCLCALEETRRIDTNGLTPAEVYTMREAVYLYLPLAHCLDFSPSGFEPIGHYQFKPIKIWLSSPTNLISTFIHRIKLTDWCPALQSVYRTYGTYQWTIRALNMKYANIDGFSVEVVRAGILGVSQNKSCTMHMILCWWWINRHKIKLLSFLKRVEDNLSFAPQSLVSGSTMIMVLLLH